jgi:hypothetical protein
LEPIAAATRSRTHPEAAAGMKKTQIYLVAAFFALLGLALFVYKWQVLKFPVQPAEQVDVWALEAHAQFKPKPQGGNRVRLVVPDKAPGYTVLSENYVSRNWGKADRRDEDGTRYIEWTLRRASGLQSLYYRATVHRVDDPPVRDSAPPLAVEPTLEEPYATAMKGLTDQVREQSADISSFASQLLMRLNDPSPSEQAELFLRDISSSLEKARLAVKILAGAKIAARVIHVVELKAESHNANIEPWIQVWNDERWLTFNPRGSAEGLPRNAFVWSVGDRKLLDVGEATNADLTLTVTRNTQDSLMVVQQREEVLANPLVKYSLLSLPIEKRSVYQFILLIPIGAFVMLILRNIIGVKTFGTFMPVLIALAFRETEIVAGIILFSLVVGFGLLVRFYLERLKLLLVPRLTAVLTLVVFLMCMTSIISHHLNIEVGLSVGLFPMVIMAMTIERMCIAWDERGPSQALRDAGGSLIVAALAHMVMSWDPLEHLILTFPELLLVLFAVTLLLGRYSGYRLTELRRFKALAKEVK